MIQEQELSTCCNEIIISDNEQEDWTRTFYCSLCLQEIKKEVGR